jgi:hypothetical protein
VFSHPVGSVGYVVDSVELGAQTIFHARWAWCGLHKKRPGTHYAELVFFHLVGSAGHVVYFGASETRNVITIFFMRTTDRYGFDKKRVGTHYAELVFFQLVDL